MPVKPTAVSHAWDFSRLSSLTLETPVNLAQMAGPASWEDSYDARCGHLAPSRYPFTIVQDIPQA